MQYVLNTETAKIAAAKSAEARKRYAAERRQTALMIELQTEAKVEAALAERPKDPYVDNLAHAQVKYLARLMDPDITAKDAAALSQALKNLRECYHMASGQPKPGTIKPERQSSRQQARPASEPKLDEPSV